MKSIKKHSIKSCAINKISQFSSFKILNKIQNLLKNQPTNNNNKIKTKSNQINKTKMLLVGGEGLVGF